MAHCSKCNSEQIVIDLVSTDFSYKGEKLAVTLHRSVCQNCGREFVSREQILQNENLFQEAIAARKVYNQPRLQTRRKINSHLEKEVVPLPNRL